MKHTNQQPETERRRREVLTTHTPGPWSGSDERTLGLRHFATVMSLWPAHKGAVICQLLGGKPYRDTEGMCNANVLAAAPDLLVACEKSLAFVSELIAVSGLDLQVEALRDGLGAAIRLAKEGRSPEELMSLIHLARESNR